MACLICLSSAGPEVPLEAPLCVLPRLTLKPLLKGNFAVVEAHLYPSGETSAAALPEPN